MVAERYGRGESGELARKAWLEVADEMRARIKRQASAWEGSRMTGCDVREELCKTGV